MRRHSVKWAVIGGMIVLIVMFGIDLASNGVERIYGPIEQDNAMTVGRLENRAADSVLPGYTAGPSTDSGTDAAALSPEERDSASGTVWRTVGEAQRSRDRGEVAEQPLPEQNERLPGIPDLRNDSTVNKLADGTAGVLQSLSSQGIRFVVSFFESVTD